MQNQGLHLDASRAQPNSTNPKADPWKSLTQVQNSLHVKFAMNLGLRMVILSQAFSLTLLLKSLIKKKGKEANTEKPN